MKNVIHAYGILASPTQVVEALNSLNISFAVVNGRLKARTKIKDVGGRQPAWPVVLPSLSALTRYKCDSERQVLFICDSITALTHCNIRVIRPGNYQESIRKALHYAVVNPFDPSWVPDQQEPTIEEYVNNATKPSFLNMLQTEFYRLVPYDLRKEVQALVIGYLAGVETKTKLMAKLATSYKLDKIKNLVKDPKCSELRDAIALYRKNQSEEETAALTGFETFEILYIVKSSGKTNLDKKSRS